MKFCVCASIETDARVSKIITALRERFNADLVVGQGADIGLALPDSDLTISIGPLDNCDADFIETVEQQCIDLVSIVFVDESEASSDPVKTGSLQLEVRATAFDADVQALLDVLDRHLTRLSDARHEYNNIAAVVGLTNNPAMLKRAREALLALRATYPEYSADPDKLDEKLGLSSEI